MKNSEPDILNQEHQENHFNSKTSEITVAVLAVISKKSRDRNRTIAATSLKEIKNGLNNYYNKDLTERHILNAIRSLGKRVIKEKDPRNHRKSLYRINPNAVKEITVTVVNLNNQQEHSKIEGILYSPLITKEKEKFLVISHNK